MMLPPVHFLGAQTSGLKTQRHLTYALNRRSNRLLLGDASVLVRQRLVLRHKVDSDKPSQILTLLLQIKWDNLSGCLTNLLGHGSYGDVWEAHYHSAPVAVKTIKIEATGASLHRVLTQFK